jgi:hypothetical protein
LSKNRVDVFCPVESSVLFDEAAGKRALHVRIVRFIRLHYQARLLELKK